MLRRLAAVAALVVLLGSNPVGAFTLVPNPILLGTTEEAQPVAPSGSAELQSNFPDFALTLAAEVTFGAVIVHPNETGIGGLHATLSAGPAPVVFEGSDLVTTLDDLVFTLDGGFVSSILAEGYDFALDPIAVLLTPLPFRISVVDVQAGRAQFSIPLDLEIAFPPSGPPAPLVIRGSLLFSQVPEPGLALLLGVGSLLAWHLRRS